MKVLFITNMFPVADYIYFGIHVNEQIDALEQTCKITKEVYFINGRESKWNYIKSIKQINQITKNQDFDLIHIHFGLSGLFLLLNPFIKVPTILSIHGSDLNSRKKFGIMKRITSMLVKKVNSVIVMNKTMFEKLVLHRDKVHVIPCGINLNKFKEKNIQKTDTKFRIGFPGNRSRPEKNFPLFQEIIQKLSDKLDIEVIEFHNMTRDEVVNNINKIDLLILTSFSEGSPQIIKEAMACNKPIISTAVGDVAYLLNGVKNCVVVNTYLTDDFISPALKIVNLQPEERVSNGRQRLLDIGLDSENVARSIYKLYQKLI